MSHYAIVLLFALIAGVLGFAVFGGAAAGISKVLSMLFLSLYAVTLHLGHGRART